MTYYVKSHYDIQGDSQCFSESSSDTGNMQLPHNSPGGYLVHVLFSQCVYFAISGPGRPSGKPRYLIRIAAYCIVFSRILWKEKVRNCFVFIFLSCGQRCWNVEIFRTGKVAQVVGDDTHWRSVPHKPSNFQSVWESWALYMCARYVYCSVKLLVKWLSNQNMVNKGNSVSRQTFKYSFQTNAFSSIQ